MEPNYLARPAYTAIAEKLSPENIFVGIDAAMEAHRTIAAGFIKDAQLTPRQLEYVNAVRYWLKHESLEPEAVTAAAPVETVSEAAEVVDAPIPEKPVTSSVFGRRKKS